MKMNEIEPQYLFKKKDWFFLGFTMFFAMGSSLVLLLPQNFIGDDGVYYARVAANLMAGKGICANPGEVYLIHPPFYPLLIGLFNFFLRNLEFSGHLVSIVSFTLTIIPLFYIAASVYSKNTAYWVTILYITNGFLLIHSPFVTADMPFTLLIYLGLAALYPVIQGKLDYAGRHVLVWSFLMGLAYLTRPEGLFFWLVGIFVLFFFTPRELKFKKRFLWVACSAGVFLTFLIPYASFVYRQSNRFQLSQGVTEILIKRQMDILPSPGYIEAKKIYLGLTDNATRRKMDELVENFSLLEYLRKENFSVVRSAFSSIRPRVFELLKYWYAGLGFFLAIVSFLAIPWGSRRKIGELLFLLYVATLSLKLFSQFAPRYFLPYFPLFLLWTGNGIDVLRQWVKACFGISEKSSRYLAVGACLTLAVPSAWYLHRTITEFPLAFEYKELGLWMKKNISDVDKEAVLSRQPAVNFYSGTKILKLPYVKSLDDLRTFMTYQHARYLVVSTDLDHPMVEAYATFLDANYPASFGFVRKKILKNRKKTTLFLYEFLGLPIVAPVV